MALRQFHFLTFAAVALAAAACSRPPANSDTQAYALVERIGRQEITRRPEEADEVGLSAETFGGRYDVLLNDRSMAAIERARVQHLSNLEALRALDRSTLSPAAARQVAIATVAVEHTVAMERFGYGSVGLGWANPYLVDHIDGAWLEAPRFLATRRPIASAAEAEAWLARLRLLDDAIIAETRRLQSDLDQGVVPPRAILDRTLTTVRSLRPASDPNAYFLLTGFRDQLAALKDLPAGIVQRYLDEAVLTVRSDVTPAYDGLIKLLQVAQTKTSDEPGVSRLPSGVEWYASALKLYTGSDMTPDQVHSLGQSLVKDISEEMNATFVEIGQPEGSVGERMRVLAADPARHYPPTDEGRAALLAAIDGQIKWVEDRLGRFVGSKPKGKLTVKPAPAIAGVAPPSAYYASGSINGSRPSVYYINLANMTEWPMFAIPTLTYHEALPGHHLQSGLGRERSDTPMLQRLYSFAAYSEGWAVYAEDLASEMGAYDTDAAGRLGYLQSLLFRAARLVVDTGLHAKHWSRDQAIDYLASTTGLPREQMQDEVDRYIVWPGRACAYMLGREKIRALRDDADAELGQNFDLKSFNDAILDGGARPLSVLEADIRAWISARKGSASAPPK